MPRLFVAAWASPEVRERAGEVQEALRARALRLRYVPPEHLHATLAFLGAVDASRVGEVETACGEAAAVRFPSTVTIDAFGGFPKGRRATVIWLGSQEQADDLVGVAREVRNRLRERGLPCDEKDAIAHVTIARAPAPVELPELTVAATPWTIGEIALVVSQTLPEGSRYEALRTWSLGT